MKTIAFFNNKGGVGKTTLVYHLAMMFSLNGVKTLAVDLDPQANLTAMFLDEDRLVELWPDDQHPETILGAIQPILSGTGDVLAEPHVERFSENLGLVPGDLGLSRFEDKLSDAWPRCHNRDEAAFRIMTAFYRIVENAAAHFGGALALVDVGPNLGAINRAALISSAQVVLPLAPDLFSLQSLKNLGPTLREWRSVWSELRSKAPATLPIPAGSMETLGYVIMQHGLRDNRPVKAYGRWIDRIPDVYRSAVLGERNEPDLQIGDDRHNLALLKHYRSLMPMAMEARKPMFLLKPADGAIGAHVQAVQACYDDFRALAGRIAGEAGIEMP
jgi:cellulose biosynthesis protein BcsQ